MTGDDASDGFFKGLGAVRRRARMPVEDVDAVRCVLSHFLVATSILLIA